MEIYAKIFCDNFARVSVKNLKFHLKLLKESEYGCPNIVQTLCKHALYTFIKPFVIYDRASSPLIAY